MRPDQDPVCPDCGQRHPQLTDEDLYDLAVNEVIIAAVMLVNDRPGEFPDLEHALQLGDAAAANLLAQGKEPPNPSDRLRGPDTIPPEKGIGFND